MIAVRIRGLSWKYSDSPAPVFEGLDMEIAAGSTVGVVGPNGSGKTTLMYCISGLIPHGFNGVIRGAVEIFGHDIRERSAAELAADVGMVFADPEAQFTAMTVEEEIIFGMENLGFPEAESGARLQEIAKLVGVAGLLDKSPYDISGGQKQRVAIAAILAMKPRILILDEPTSMIDPVGKLEIFDMLRRLKRESGLTLIIVEHNMEELARIADRMIMIYEGTILRDAPAETFLRNTAFLHAHGLAAPDVTCVFDQLAADGLYAGPLPLDVAPAAEQALRLLGEGA